jgi:excisionase family DNA binding protein
MPRTKSKPKNKPKAQPPAPAGEVLTLPEVAAYLRLPADKVEKLARRGELPGRQIDAGEWRFLKSSVNGWLKGSLATNKEAWMAVAGVWKDDPTVDEMLKDIYRQRGRPMTENGE